MPFPYVSVSTNELITMEMIIFASTDAASQNQASPPMTGGCFHWSVSGCQELSTASLPHCPILISAHSPQVDSDCSLRNNINEQKAPFYLGYLQTVPKALRIPGEPVMQLVSFGNGRSYNKSGQRIKKQIHHFANKGPSSQSHGFSSSHIWM